MNTITIPRETFDLMQRALEVLNNLDTDINFLNTNGLEEMVDKALAAAKAVSETKVKLIPTAEELGTPVQPQAQGETDYYADARTWYEWSTHTNWHAPKWDDLSPLGLARVEKQYQDARALEQAWRLCLRESRLWANDGKTLNIFAAGFNAGRNHTQASEPAWRTIETAPKNKEVIVAIQGGSVTTGSLVPNMGWIWYETDDEPEDAKVIAWQPLPAAPEATK